jgi:hypothetical protein
VIGRQAAALLLALAVGPACSEPVTYSYFVVEAKLDPATVDFGLLSRIGACAAIAETPVRSDSADLGCRRFSVQHNLGKFEYTTTLTSGDIKFIVVANDLHQQTLARGETTVAIQPGKTVDDIVVTAVAVPDVPENPNLPGTDDAGARD